MFNANKILQLFMLFVTAQMAFAEADLDYLMLAKISSDDAARRVVRGTERVLDVKKVMINGREVYVIKVLDPGKGRVRHQKVDAESGKVLGK